jgi:hypothetical protein
MNTDKRGVMTKEEIIYSKLPKGTKTVVQNNSLKSREVIKAVKNK